MKAVAIALLIWITAPLALAGPFGLNVGQSAESLGTEWGENGSGGSVDVPNPLQIFDQYEVYGTNATGLCAVRVRAPATTTADLTAVADEAGRLIRAHSGKTPEWIGPSHDLSAQGPAKRAEKREMLKAAFWEAERHRHPDAEPWKGPAPQ